MSSNLHNRKTNNPPVVENGEWVNGTQDLHDPLFLSDDDDSKEDETSTAPLVGSTVRNSCNSLTKSVVNAEHAVEGVFWTALHKFDGTMERCEKMLHRKKVAATTSNSEEKKSE